MELKINSKDFLNGLRQVAPAVRKNPIIPITECVLIESDYAGEGSIKITGTGSGLTIVHFIICESCDQFSFALPFFDACRVFETINGECVISVTSTQIEVVCGSDAFHLGKPEDANLFPAVPDKEDGFDLEVDGDFFWGLKLASGAVNKNPAVYQSLLDVRIDFGKKDLLVFASDNFQAFFKRVSVGSKQKQISLDPELLKPVFKFQDSNLFVSDRFLWVEHNRTTVIISLSESKHLPIRDILSRKTETNFKSTPNDFRSAVDKVLVYDDHNRAFVTRLLFSDGKAELVYKDDFYNKSAKWVVNLDGADDKSIKLNGKILKSVVSRFGTETKCLEISVTDESAPIFFSSVEEQVTSFIQPINI